MNPLAYIKSAIDFVTNLFGYGKQRDAELNAADMKEALKAKREQEAQDEVIKHAESGTLDDIRRDNSGSA